MEPATFFAKFNQFADASNAVAKLRELVPHLAASGQYCREIALWDALVDYGLYMGLGLLNLGSPK
jgi:hypothetical protein